MSFSPLRFGPLRLLLLLNLLLAAGLAWLWFDEHAQLRSLAWVAPKALPPDIKLPSGPPKTDPTAGDASPYAVILERPLFAPDRRPPPPPAPPPPPDPFATIQIRGVFSGDSAGILATVDGKSRRIKIKESIGNWTLKSIDGRDVTFTQGEETRKVRLAYARLNAPIPPTLTINPPPAPAPGPVSAPTPVPTPTPVTGTIAPAQKAQDEAREILRRRNELRTSRGLPPLTQ